MARKPELLCPAGDMEKLQMAVLYGADAVYLAGTSFGMRSFTGNFTPEELPKAIQFAHEHGVRVHVTVNTMPRNDEAAALPAWLEQLDAAGADALILAEHYGDASDWLSGDQWDTVMNYDAFMEPISWFLTGLEKHSERKDEHLLHNSQAFMCSMLSNMSRMQTGSLYAAMNELSNHDHSRFLTRTNRVVGRLYKPEDAENAEKGINYGTFRSGALIQMTWPGAPTIYYGDEAGVCGWTDPDNRRTFPWGKEDLELTEFHRYLTGIRNRTSVFRRGAFKPLLAENGMIAYGRFDADEQGVVVVNSEDYAQRVRIPVWEAEVTADAMVRVMLTDAKRYNVGSLKYPVVDGVMEVELPGNGAMIFIARSSGQDDEKTA